MTSEKPVRIYKLAKRLNISHNDIISLLDKHGIDAKINTVLDEDSLGLVLSHFSDDERKAQDERKEKHSLKKAEEEHKKRQDAQKKSEEEAFNRLVETVSEFFVEASQDRVEERDYTTEIPEISGKLLDYFTENIEEYLKNGCK